MVMGSVLTARHNVLTYTRTKSGSTQLFAQSYFLFLGLGVAFVFKFAAK